MMPTPRDRVESTAAGQQVRGRDKALNQPGLGTQRASLGSATPKSKVSSRARDLGRNLGGTKEGGDGTDLGLDERPETVSGVNRITVSKPKRSDIVLAVTGHVAFDLGLLATIVPADATNGHV